MTELLKTFGSRVASTSIIGKAGILCGDVGDIMLATGMRSQYGDGVYHFRRRQNLLTRDLFEGLYDQKKIHASL